ncbi:helix-turn-helix transcriptional regulator [Nocardiopsis sp. RSe5-2]|uniref:Helix-turn-helix transcriptional regulator n=1 Tax=Nocardiopsis endophytica TaxID=3018445 RepID=A0ABT4UE76_9ACTN|nr:helix-turn-helix transcriptional regulator [Nocardiopsis endophytica]MDA2815276.1 helix-turn-helix transcriptional regulator [Nocardiopsis endophytica]
MAASPTLRRRRVARLLFQQRERSGLTAKAVAAEAKRISGKARGWSESKINRLETGEWKRLSIDDVLLLLDIYEVTDEGEREDYTRLVREANQKGWWATYENVLGGGQLIGLEAEASSIRSYQSMTVPGLLQTESYARAMATASAMGETGEVERRVEARMLRKAVFSKAQPPAFWTVIDEAALLHITPELSDQLEHLLDVSRHPHIGIQVLPVAHGPHAAMTGHFVIMEFPMPDPPVVYLEAVSEELYLESENQVREYQRRFDYVQASALSVDESRELIRTRLSAL